MTTKELIRKLEKMNEPDAEVVFFDANTGASVPINFIQYDIDTGMIELIEEVEEVDADTTDIN